jgi:hypothetical protein
MMSQYGKMVFMRLSGVEIETEAETVLDYLLLAD